MFPPRWKPTDLRTALEPRRQNYPSWCRFEPALTVARNSPMNRPNGCVMKQSVDIAVSCRSRAEK